MSSNQQLLILNLPDQPQAIKDTLDSICAAVPYSIDPTRGPYIETHEDVIKARFARRRRLARKTGEQ